MFFSPRGSSGQSESNMCVALQLLAAGASGALADAQGTTPLMVAASGHSVSTKDVLDKVG